MEYRIKNLGMKHLLRPNSQFILRAKSMNFFCKGKVCIQNAYQQIYLDMSSHCCRR